MEINHDNLFFEDLFVEKKYNFKNFDKDKYLKIFNPNEFDLFWQISNDNQNQNIMLRLDPSKGIIMSKQII